MKPFAKLPPRETHGAYVFRQEFFSVSCPTCGAPRFKVCMSKNDVPQVHPHKLRIMKYRELARARGAR